MQQMNALNCSGMIDNINLDVPLTLDNKAAKT